MRANIFLPLLLLFFIGYGCVSKKYIYLQNKTNHDIQIYKKEIVDVGQDSVMKMAMKKNNIHENYETGTLAIQYHKILKKDSLAFLDIVYGEKSRTELVDPNSNYFNGLLIIISNADTILFTQKEIMKKINESWSNKNSNSTIKLKAYEKNQLIWEFED
jgi:hypothetical protein